jgi:hypothetical protein
MIIWVSKPMIVTGPFMLRTRMIDVPIVTTIAHLAKPLASLDQVHAHRP